MLRAEFSPKGNSKTRDKIRGYCSDCIQKMLPDIKDFKKYITERRALPDSIHNKFNKSVLLTDTKPTETFDRFRYNLNSALSKINPGEKIDKSKEEHLQSHLRLKTSTQLHRELLSKKVMPSSTKYSKESTNATAVPRMYHHLHDSINSGQSTNRENSTGRDTMFTQLESIGLSKQPPGSKRIRNLKLQYLE